LVFICRLVPPPALGILRASLTAADQVYEVVPPSQFRLAEPLAVLAAAREVVCGQPPGQALYKTIVVKWL